MKKKIVIGLLLVAVVVAIIGYRMYHEENPDYLERDPDFTVDALALLSEFETDSAAANRKYANKALEVTGTVKGIDTSGVIILGNADQQSSVICGLDERHKRDHQYAEVARPLTLRGKYTGYRSEEMLGMNLGTNVEINFSGIINK